MAFDISRLTGAVNRHLNSISDLSSQIRQAAEESTARAQFSIDLKNAIEENIKSHMPDDGVFSDYGKEIREDVTLGDTISNTSLTDLLLTAGDVTSKDAYSGGLSLEALQELSKSQYFNVNLIQSSLFNDSSQADDKTSAPSINNINRKEYSI